MDEQQPVVVVRGEAEVRVPPDRATLWVTVEARERTAAETVSRLAERGLRLDALLDALPGLASRAASGVSVHPLLEEREGRGGRPRRVVGHVGRVTRTVVFDDPTGLGEAVEQLTGTDGIELSGPSWSLHAGHPAHAEARRAAIADGQVRAADYAAAFGCEVTGLLEISDLDGGASVGPMMWRAQSQERMDGEPGLDLEPEVQTVTGRVTLRLTITAPSPDRLARPDRLSRQDHS